MHGLTLLAGGILVLGASVPAQIRLERVSKEAVPDVEAPSESVAVADLDGDGLRDLVFGNQDTLNSPNHVYRNVGGGRFADRSGVWLPLDDGYTSDVAAGDVDGDGDVDVLITDFRTSNRLYLNDGTGRLVDATLGRLPPGPPGRTVLLFDADGDADLDAFLGVASNGTSALLRNDGAGRFTYDATAIPGVPLAVREAIAVDVDGDADLDLVTGGGFALSTQNRLLLNDGGGRFTDVTATQMPVDDWENPGLASGDVDGDGDPDLVFANYWSTEGNQTYLYLNDGSGRFTDVTAAGVPQRRGSARDVELGDVDGDSDPDLVVGNTAGSIEVLLNDGSGRFTDAPAGTWNSQVFTETSDVELVDLDRDGDLDVVAAHGTYGHLQRNRVYLNDSGRFFDTATELLAPRSVTDVAFADVDGDNDVDVLAIQSSQLQLMRNESGARFGAMTPVGTITSIPVGMLVDDFDGDGDPDALVTGYGGYDLLANDGSGRFSAVAGFPAGLQEPAVLASGDLDGDGDQDVVVGTGLGTADQVLWNDGTGRFAVGPTLPDTDITTGLAFGDVDGNGSVDVVTSNYQYFDPRNPWVFSAGGVRVALQTSPGVFVAGGSVPAAQQRGYYQSIELADADGDGDLDVLANGPHLLLNDGAANFSPAPAPYAGTTGRSWESRFADVDGDGDPEILDAALLTPPVLWENDGAGGYVQRPGAWDPPTDSAEGFRVLDADGDGDIDVLTLDAQPPGWRLYQNLAQQLIAKDVARLGRGYRVEARSTDGTAALLFVDLGWSATPLETPFGRLQLDALTAIALPVTGMTAGRAEWTLPLPSLQSAAGLELHAQGAVLRASAGIRLTNATVDRVIQ